MSIMINSEEIFQLRRHILLAPIGKAQHLIDFKQRSRFEAALTGVGRARLAVEYRADRNHGFDLPRVAINDAY